jgi:hypothetical protein
MLNSLQQATCNRFNINHLEAINFNTVQYILELISNVVRDQGVGGSNPLSPTNVFNNLQEYFSRKNPAVGKNVTLFSSRILHRKDHGAFVTVIQAGNSNVFLQISPCCILLGPTSKNECFSKGREQISFVG